MRPSGDVVRQRDHAALGLVHPRLRLRSCRRDLDLLGELDGPVPYRLDIGTVDRIDLDLQQISSPARFYRGLEDDAVARVEHLAAECRGGARRALVLDAGEDLGQAVRDLHRRFRVDERAAAHHRGVPQVIHGNRARAIALWIHRGIGIGQVGPGLRSGGNRGKSCLLVGGVEYTGGSERERGEIDVLPPRDVLAWVEIGIVGAGRGRHVVLERRAECPVAQVARPVIRGNVSERVPEVRRALQERLGPGTTYLQIGDDQVRRRLDDACRRHRRQVQVAIANGRRRRDLVRVPVREQDVVVVLATDRRAGRILVDRVQGTYGKRIDGRIAACRPALFEQVADAEHGRNRRRLEIADGDAVQRVVPRGALRQVPVLHVDPEDPRAGAIGWQLFAEIVEADAIADGVGALRCQVGEGGPGRGLRGIEACRIAGVPVGVIDRLGVDRRRRRRQPGAAARVNRGRVVDGAGGRRGGVQVPAMERTVLHVLVLRQVVLAIRRAYAGAEAAPLVVGRVVAVVAEQHRVDGVVMARNRDRRADRRAAAADRGGERTGLTERIAVDGYARLVGGDHVVDVGPRIAEQSAGQRQAADRVGLVVVTAHHAIGVGILQQRRCRDEGGIGGWIEQDTRRRRRAHRSGLGVNRRSDAATGDDGVDVRTLGEIATHHTIVRVTRRARIAALSVHADGQVIIVASAGDAFRKPSGPRRIAAGTAGPRSAILRSGIGLARRRREVSRRHHRIAGESVDVLVAFLDDGCTTKHGGASIAGGDDVRARPVRRTVVAVQNLVAELLVEILRAGGARRRLPRVVVAHFHARHGGCRCAGCGRCPVDRAVDAAVRADGRRQRDSRCRPALEVGDIRDREIDARRDRPVGIAVERHGNASLQVVLDAGGEHLQVHVALHSRVEGDGRAHVAVGVGHAGDGDRCPVSFQRRVVGHRRVVHHPVEVGREKRRRRERVVALDGRRAVRDVAVGAAAIRRADGVRDGSGGRRDRSTGNGNGESGAVGNGDDLELAVVLRLDGADDVDELANEQRRRGSYLHRRNCANAGDLGDRHGRRGAHHVIGNVVERHAAGVVERVDDVRLCRHLGRDRGIGEIREHGIDRLHDLARDQGPGENAGQNSRRCGTGPLDVAHG